MLKVAVHGQHIPTGGHAIPVPERTPDAVRRGSKHRLDSLVFGRQSPEQVDGAIRAVVVHKDDLMQVITEERSEPHHHGPDVHVLVVAGNDD